MDRFVVRLLMSACRVMWGFAPRVMPAAVERMGPAGTLRWFAANMPRYLVSLKVLGPLRFHLSGMIISIRNGCLYCAYGHGYALELIYLRDRNRLFPLDARTLDDWLGLDPHELRIRIRDVLQNAGMHAEAMWADRTCDLVEGDQQPVDRDEMRLAHLVRMIGTMNGIAVDAGIAPDEAQNPINKDAAVKARHEGLRARL